MGKWIYRVGFLLSIIAVAGFVIQYISSQGFGFGGFSGFSFPQLILLIFVGFLLGIAMVVVSSFGGLIIKKPVNQIINVAVAGGIVAVMDYVVSATAPVQSEAYLFVWPSQALFSVSGIWFGIWGALGVYIGHVLYLGSLVLPLDLFMISIMLGFSPFFAALIPDWAFRFFKADPRLKTSRDGFIFMVFGVVLSSLATTLIGATVWYFYFFGLVSWTRLITVSMPASFNNGLMVTPIIGFPPLWLFSRIVMKARAYCKGWFS